MSLLDKRIYFHVGSHQSGAWLIQRYLERHSEFLFAGGVHALPRDQLNSVIGWGGRLVKNPEGLANVVSQALHRRRTYAVVASHENMLGRPFGVGGGLYAGSTEAIQTLAATAESYGGTAVLSVRPQADFLEAYYLQLVNEGAREPFDVWLSALDLTDISWMPLYDRLVSSFGHGKVHVVDFRRAEESRVAFVRDFLTAINVDVPIDIADRAAVTPTWSDRGLRIVLAANAHMTSSAQRSAFRSFVRAQFNEKDQGSAILLTAEQRAYIDDLYMTEYEQLTGTSRGRNT